MSEMKYRRKMVPNSGGNRAQLKPIVTNPKQRVYQPTEKQKLALACPCETVLFGGARGGGKMQPLTAKILTPSGWTQMGKLRIGSIIVDPRTGGKQTVTKIFDHPAKDVYDVKFEDGRHCQCGLEHLWMVCKAIRPTHVPCRPWEVLSLEEILAHLASRPLEKVYVPLCNPVRYAKQERPLPYPPIGMGKHFGESLDKKIKLPEYYLFSSIAERISLIQGLFSTTGGKFFITPSETLARQAQHVLRSLGCACRIERKYEINHANPFFKVSDSTRREKVLAISSIKKNSQYQCRCISVSGKDGLYLTDNFIVTHNTECCRFKILQHVQLYGKHARILLMRKSLRELEQIIDRCRTMYNGIAVWREQKKRFEFRNGAICEFNYLDSNSIINYQGSEYTLVILDEVGQFDSYDNVKLLRGCLRSPAGVPCQLFMTCNPGGRLHNILKAEFIDPAPRGMVPIEDVDEATGERMGTYRVYIPAWLFENPYLMRNDPSYIQRLRQTGSPEMVRAWLKGDWDIISGGAFDKQWDRDIHVIKPFSIPRAWRIVASYDDGRTKPSVCLWFAVSDGSDYYLPSGEKRSTLRGDVFVIAELYFWSGKPNQGDLDCSTAKKAELILAKEVGLKYEISQRIADSAIFSSKVRSIANEFEEAGVYFDPCAKAPGTRVIAANLFRNMLAGSLERDERPGIFFFSTCHHCIRTIPTLPRDKKNPDDVDSGAEDHCYDAVCYFLLSDWNSIPQVADAGNI